MRFTRQDVQTQVLGIVGILSRRMRPMNSSNLVNPLHSHRFLLRSPSSHAEALHYQKISVTQNPTKILNLTLNIFMTSMTRTRTWTRTSNMMSTLLRSHCRLTLSLWHLPTRPSLMVYHSTWSLEFLTRGLTQPHLRHTLVLQHQKIALNSTKFLNLILSVFMSSMTQMNNVMSTRISLHCRLTSSLCRLPVHSSLKILLSTWFLQQFYKSIRTTHQLPSRTIYLLGSAYRGLRQKLPTLDYRRRMGTNSHREVYNKQATRQDQMPTLFSLIPLTRRTTPLMFRFGIRNLERQLHPSSVYNLEACAWCPPFSPWAEKWYIARLEPTDCEQKVICASGPTNALPDDSRFSSIFLFFYLPCKFFPGPTPDHG